MASSPSLRETARAILLDEDERVMLLHYEASGPSSSFWATPGGALEPGESHREALCRELREELGLHKVVLGPLIATRTQEHAVGSQFVRQAEHYYLVRARARAVDPRCATHPDDIRAWRWWTLPELRASDSTVYPPGLSSLVADLLTSAPPAIPRILR